ncbi:MAG: hypothetical protein WC748_09815 [Legionellales bacterium]|jgi:hypothetical protein
MKVWEKIREIKCGDEECADVTVETITSWAWNNKICPLAMFDGLEIEESEYPKELEDAEHEACSKFDGKCGIECLQYFLNIEVTL